MEDFRHRIEAAQKGKKKGNVDHDKLSVSLPQNRFPDQAARRSFDRLATLIVRTYHKNVKGKPATPIQGCLSYCHAV
jgi:hypothetical protein